MVMSFCLREVEALIFLEQAAKLSWEAFFKRSPAADADAQPPALAGRASSHHQTRSRPANQLAASQKFAFSVVRDRFMMRPC